MSADDTPPPPPDPPGDDETGFTAPERLLAGVLLAGAVALAYICLDVMSGGRITRTLTRESP